MQNVIRTVQKSEFAEDIVNIKKGKITSGKIRNLNPFIDDNDMLRVGGRLSKCNVNYNRKYPLILPAKQIIIESYHKCWPTKSYIVFGKNFGLEMRKNLLFTNY